MGLGLAREIFWIQLAHLLALTAVLLANLAFLGRAGKDSTLYRYIQLQSCLALWILAKIMKTISPTADIRWAWIVVQYLGVCALGPSFFHFAFRYAIRRRPRGIAALYAIGGAFFVVFATNPAHHLYYATYYFYDDSFGPVFYVHSAYTYGLILAGIWLAARGFGRGRSRSQTDIAIAASASIPLVVNALYIAGAIKPLFDVTPIMMSLSLGLFAFAAFRHGFLGVLPFDADSIIRGLPDPVVVTSPSGEVAYSTMPDDATDFGRYSTRRIRGYRIELFADFGRMRRLEREYDERNRVLQGLNARLQEQNAKKAVLYEAEASNRARMDLHDVLGHSITLVTLLLRSAASRLAAAPDEARRLAAQAYDQARASITRLDGIADSCDGSGGRGGFELLSRLVGDIVASYQDAGLAVEYSSRGRERALSAPLARALERCCQEAFTNAVKHAGARSVFAGAVFGPASVTLAVVDDGAGTDSFQPGQGITMMRDRLEPFGGELRVSTAPGEGFCLSIVAPYLPPGARRAEAGA